MSATQWQQEVTSEAVPGATRADGSAYTRRVVRVSCTVGVFAITAERDLHSPADGPETLRIEGRWQDAPAGQMDGPWGGITTDTLRAVPMQELRRRLADAAEEALRAEGDVPQIPARTDTPADLAAFCRVYVELVEAGHRKPLHRLSELTGVSRNTLSARIRRAREQGILTRPTSTEAGGTLTELGRSLLSAEEG